MSKASKSIRSMKRKAEKRGRKAMNASRYAAMTEAGQNKKSKRVTLKSQRRATFSVTSHRFGPCGNTGCNKCCPTTRVQHDAKQALITEGMAKSRAAKALKAKLVVQAKAKQLAAKQSRRGLADVVNS